MMRGKKRDLAGELFGRLRVLEQGPHAPDGTITWRCRCLCGTTRIVRACSLTSGRTRSCGCLRDEVLRERMHPSRAVADQRARFVDALDRAWRTP